MKKIPRFKLIYVSVFLLTMIIGVNNLYSFDVRIIDTSIWGGGSDFCPCCQDTDSTKFAGWKHLNVDFMVCLQCNVPVTVTRNPDLTYKVKADDCSRSNKIYRSIASSEKIVTYPYDKVAIAEFSSSPYYRIIGMSKNKDNNFWESWDGFVKTIAVDLSVPWGKKFVLHEDDDGKHHLTFELPDSLMDSSEGASQSMGITLRYSIGEISRKIKISVQFYIIEEVFQYILRLTSIVMR